jgi:hypothetical protein
MPNPPIAEPRTIVCEEGRLRVRKGGYEVAVYRGGLLPLIYVVVGAFVAGTHHYFAHTGSVRAVGSALLAIFLWPLVLLGISLHVH